MGCYPDKPALIDADTDETLSFSQLKSTVLKLSHAFLNLGVNRTDRVLMFAPNSIYFSLCFFAVTAICSIATTANPLYTLHELSKQVKDSNPKLVVTVPELLDSPSDSSGMTGVSNGVVLTHRNFIAAALMVTMDKELAGEMHRVFLCVLPVFHVFGLAVIAYGQLQKANSLVSMSLTWDVFEEYREV
ncbi:AMP-dependent synthetase and ligase family protein isoform 2 [Hibiscus syriacus]|uniref:AMP-dependent synthetase and ligase family protein isoform 2 n=1 Tax=Hibiscus syriacus TaxID=106335 RepID=A0A6A3CUY2_HIBSY|nr:AMP-dependent synthetase and ligase family protein isoform 2 [Hibiscus syriacus]